MHGMTITNVRTGPVKEDAFTWKEQRTLSRALTLQYDQVLFPLEPSEQAKTAKLSIVAARHRGGAISRMLVSLKSADILYFH
jgi:hypothetical protein